MSENNVFNEALSNFTKEFAYAAAVRHLYDKGYTVEMIKDSLDYPASEEQIQKVISDYEAKRSDPKLSYKYVEDVNEYGKKSYRKVLNIDNEQ